MSSNLIKSILGEISTATIDASFMNKITRLLERANDKKETELLLQHNALQVISNRIATCTDKDTNEILLGIIEKICIWKEGADALLDNKPAMAIVLRSIHTKYHSILILLMYLIRNLMEHVHPGNYAAKLWLNFFVEVPDFMTQYCSILRSTTNVTEQICTLETLHIILKAIAPRNPHQYNANMLAIFYRVFINKTLVTSSSENFKLFMTDKIIPGFGYFPDTQQVMITFLKTHLILSSYEDVSIDCYKECEEPVMCWMRTILIALLHFVTVLPVNNLDVQMAVCVNGIFKQLRDPIDNECFVQMIQMWEVVKTRRDKATQNVELKNEFYQLVSEILKRIVNRTSIDLLKIVLVSIDSRIVEKYVSTLEILANAANSESDIKSCYTKIITARERLCEP